MTYVGKTKTLVLLLVALVSSFTFLSNIRSASAQTTPVINNFSPTSAYWGQQVVLYGENFGNYVDDDTTFVTFTLTKGGTPTIATIQYPVATNWLDNKITLQVPANLEPESYQIAVTIDATNTSNAIEFIIVDYSTPADLVGTPDYTDDYVISNTQSINVSKAIRGIAQGFLLPSKETIQELGRYIQDSLTLKLNLGSQDQLNDTSSTYSILYTNVWSFSRNLVNSLFLIALIITAYLFIFRINPHAYSYSLRSLLPRFMLAAILANFSFLIAHVILDIGLITTHIILDNLALPEPNLLATTLLGDLRLNVFVLFMLGFYLLINVIMALVLIMLVLRTVAIWLLLALSPFPCLMMVFPGGGNVLKSWLKKFLQLLFIGPVFAFLLFVGTELSKSVVSDFENSDLVRAFIGVATLTILLATPMLFGNASTFFNRLLTGRDSSKSKTTDKPATSNTKQLRTDEAQAMKEQIKSKMELHDLDDSKIETIKIPLTGELQQKFQQLIGNRKENAIETTDSDKETKTVDSEANSGGIKPTVFTKKQSGKKEKDESKTEKTTAPAAPKQTDKLQTPPKKEQTVSQLEQVVAAKSPAKTSKNTEKQKFHKLFSTAPKQLVINWLKDNDKVKIISAGIVAQKGEVENEKAVAILDAPRGKKLLSDMYEKGNQEEKQASSAMIGNVLLSYPDRMQKVIQDATKAPPPLNEAAQSILKAGMVRLGQQISENPADEKLQRAAERMVMYAPHLLTNALTPTPAEGTGFIRIGVDQVAQNIGGNIVQITSQVDIPTLKHDESKAGKAYRDLSNLAAQTVILPQVEITQLGKNQEEIAFVAAALLSDSPSQKVAEQKFIGALTSDPANVQLQRIATEVFKNTPAESTAQLPAPILQAVSQYMQSDEFKKEPDKELVMQYLNTNSPSALSTSPALSTEVIANLNLPELIAAVPEAERERLELEMPARIALAADIPALIGEKPEIIESLQANLPTIMAQNPELALTAALKMFSEVPEAQRQVITQTTRDIVTQAITKEETRKNITDELYTASVKQIIQTSSDNPELLNQVVPAALQSDGFARVIASEDARTIIAQIPIEQLGTMMKDKNPNPNFARQAASNISADKPISPELASRIALVTPEHELGNLPWNIIKGMLEFLVKLDRHDPLYNQLYNKLKDYPQFTSLVDQLPQKEKEIMQDAKPPEMKPEELPSALKEIQDMPFEQLNQIDINIVEQALQQAGDKEGRPSPELAAKLVQTLPMDDLKKVFPQYRAAAADYLMKKNPKEYNDKDAELAARIVSATPPLAMEQLGESILTLAATIAKSNLSFADRDQLQAEIARELASMISPEQDKEKKEEKDKEGDAGSDGLAKEEEENPSKIKIAV